jgi:DNA-binding NtrC family response regulator
VKPRLIITDLKMKRMGGFELLTHLRRGSPDILIIIVTAFGSVESAVAAMQLGAHDYLVKPFVALNCVAIPQGLIESELRSSEGIFYPELSTIIRGN